MSIWGKRVDGWFTERARSRTAINHAGLNALWQVALILAVCVIALYVID